MNRSIFLLLATIFTITGCSSPTPPAPEERPSGSFTAINIPALSELWVSGSVQLSTKNKRGCGQFPGNILPSTIDDDYLVDIDANSDIFLNISRTDEKSTCNFLGLFYASKGNEYIVKFEVKGKQCEFTLTEKTPTGTQRKISTYPSYISVIDGQKVCDNKDKLY